MLGSDPSVSSRHLRLMANGASLLAEDLDSANGSFINGSRMAHGSIDVEQGDRIRVGESVLEVCARSPVDAAPTSVEAAPPDSAVATEPPPPEVSPEAMRTFLHAWEDEISYRAAFYNGRQSSLVGALLIVIVGAGLSIDKLSGIGPIPKILFAGAIVLLVFAIGNNLNCTTATSHAQLYLHELRRALALNTTDAPDIAEVDANLIALRDEGIKYIPHAYWCSVLAVLSGLTAFFIVLVQA